MHLKSLLCQIRYEPLIVKLLKNKSLIYTNIFSNSENDKNKYQKFIIFPKILKNIFICKNVWTCSLEFFQNKNEQTYYKKGHDSSIR